MFILKYSTKKTVTFSAESTCFIYQVIKTNLQLIHLKLTELKIKYSKLKKKQSKLVNEINVVSKQNYEIILVRPLATVLH